MKFLLSLLALTSLSALSLASAQSPLTWLDSLVSSEEHLLHRERVGPYTVSADGQRLINNPYLEFDVRYSGERLPASSTVRVDAALHHEDEEVRTRYEAVYDEGRFVIDPLELPGAETWAPSDYGWLVLDLFIDGPAGRGEGQVSFDIYPPKPETGRLFSTVNFGLPFVILALFALLYRSRRVRLQTLQPAAD